MKDKIVKTLLLISECRNEITEIYPSGNEYYFSFRGRVFSIAVDPHGARFYIYPRYRGIARDLANAMEHGIEDPDLTYVSVADNDVEVKLLNDPMVITKFYGWFQEKYLGLDDLFDELGVR